MLGSGRGISCEDTYAPCLGAARGQRKRTGGALSLARLCAVAPARPPAQQAARERRRVRGETAPRLSRGEVSPAKAPSRHVSERCEVSAPVLRAARRTHARREVRALGGRNSASRRACAGTLVESPARRVLRGGGRTSRSGGASSHWRAAGPDGLRRLPPRVLRKCSAVDHRRVLVPPRCVFWLASSLLRAPVSAPPAAREPEGVAPKLALPP